MALLLTPSPRLKYASGVVRRQLLGLGFLVVVAGLVTLSIALYNHAFTPFKTVYLQVTTVGNQLPDPADVQLRGIDVGQVTGEQLLPGATGVRLTLQMKPADLALIPYNVQAEILPETLFGEKFVNLVLPPDPSGHLVAGETIGLDRSKSALEFESVLNNLLPFLSYVQPAQLNQTLTAFAQALAGQAPTLRRNFVLADQYFARLNGHLPQLDVDLERLAPVLASYGAAAPHLLAMLANFSQNATVVTSTQNQLAGFLSASIGASAVGEQVVARNARDLILLASSSRPALDVNQTYAAELPCLLGGLANLEPRLNQALTGGELHITLFDDVDRGGYTAPADSPTAKLPYVEPGPECYGLPGPTTNYNVGYPGPPSANYPPGTSANYPPGTYPNSGASLTTGNVGNVGSLAEQSQLSSLVLGGGGAPLGARSGGVGDLLLGPLLRGTTVRLG